MKIAMMQPAFLPWQGFFELLYKSDCFIVLDDFQFSVQSYHQRNRLFVNKEQIGWYTVPVRKKASFGGTINNTVINNNIPWRIKMWKRIQQNYSKASYFNEIAPLIKEWLLSSNEVLSDFNIAFINIVCSILKIDTKILLSSQFTTKAHRSYKVLELLRWGKATQYLCAKGSFGYMKKDAIFPVDDIEILFQDYTPEKYVQIGSETDFFPFLSILDALLNIGPDQTLELIKNGTEKWLTWDRLICFQSKNSIEA
ncbi:MAG: WbqC family protein [Bacilli bacterium]